MVEQNKPDLNSINISQNVPAPGSDDIDNVMQNLDVDISKLDYKEYDKDKRKMTNYYGNEEIYFDERSNVTDRFISNLEFDISLSDIVRLLKQEESVKIVSSPSVTTINNTTANLTVQNTLSLSIKPLIGNSEYIKLSINCNIFETTLGQHIISEVYIKNGEPFILGEITKNRKVIITKKVPILGSIIPFLFSIMTVRSPILILPGISIVCRLARIFLIESGPIDFSL